MWTLKLITETEAWIVHNQNCIAKVSLLADNKKNIALILAVTELLQACKCLLADLEGTTELLELDEVPEHIKLSIIEGRNAIQKAEREL